MQNRFALAIASAAALLLLLFGVGLAQIINTGPAAGSVVVSAGSSDNVQVAFAPDQPSIEQQVQSLLASRESAYRRALDDANSKLQQANAQLEQAYAIIDTLKQARSTSATATPAPPPAQQAQQGQAGQSATVAPAPAYAVSPDEAAAIALVIEPSGTVLKMPDLVSFHGTPAYEVQLDLGIVYVDANSRSVLYDAVPPVQSTGGNPANQERETNGRDEGND